MNGNDSADNTDISIHLSTLHSHLCNFFPAIERIAIALYQPDSDMLHTYINSTHGMESPIKHYQVQLESVPSLKSLADSGQNRCVDDLSVYESSTKLHSRAIINAGFKSSFTLPMKVNGNLLGFVFFDSTLVAYFGEAERSYLTLFAQLLFAYIKHDFSAIQTLRGALRTASAFGRYRDEETAEHLIRMSHYSKLLAQCTANEFDLSESFIEFIYQFAPLHDIGKIAIPDVVLFKPEKLTEKELVVMKTHVEKGADMVDMMISEFGLGTIHNIDILRNIVRYHHERFDGGGYPYGLRAKEIPVEARIVAVADVFDALTSTRPYKSAWTLSDTMAYFEKESGGQFDPVCVDALNQCLPEFEKIKLRYSASVN